MTDKAADFDEARWRRLADARALSEPLADSDEEFLARFSPRSQEAEAEAELFAALGGLGGPDDDGEEAANSPLVDATVQHVLAAQRAAAETVASTAPSRSRRPWFLGGLAMAAAAVAIVWTVRATSGESTPKTVGPIAQAETAAVDTTSAETPGANAAPIPTSPSVEPPVVTGPVAMRVMSGQWVNAEGATLGSGSAPRGVLVAKAPRGCIGVATHTVCMGGGGRIELVDPGVLGTHPHLRLLEGTGTIIAEAPTSATDPRVSSVWVEIASDRYRVSSPVTIETEVINRKLARVEVTSGQVEWIDGDGTAHTLTAGQVRGRTRVGKAPPVADAKTLLARARASRAGGDRAAAINHYEQLLRAYPDLAASRAAMVSLGDLYLAARKPKRALHWFERYLDTGGALAQEAHVGRIKALGSLGRAAARRTAVEAFRAKYPSSRYTDQFGAEQAAP